MKSVAMAAIVSILGGVLVHTRDCSVGTHEQCLMSRGLLWLYIVAMFVLFLVVIACANSVIRYLKNEDQ